MEKMDITLCVTSCGRLDLLAPTLTSLMPQMHLFSDVIIIDDDGDAAVKEWVEAQIPKAKVLLNEQRLGQLASIDKMYGEVRTPFVFHCEDDWVFVGDGFIEAAFAAITKEPSVSTALVRRLSELPDAYLQDATRAKAPSSDYVVFAPHAHREYLGFSFNPGVVAHATWQKYGPYVRYETEGNLSYKMKKDGFTIACLDPGHCRHIGDGHHVDDPFQPVRAKTPIQRLRRSIQKRITRVRRLYDPLYK